MARLDRTFVFLAQDSKLAKPTVGSLHDPSSLQEDKATLLLGPFDDFDLDACLSANVVDDFSTICAINPNMSQRGVFAMCFPQDGNGTVTILDRSGRDA